MFSFQASAQFFDYPAEVLDSVNLVVNYRFSWKEDTNDLENVGYDNMILLVGKKVSMFTSKNYYEFMFLGRKAEREGRLQEFLGQDMSNFGLRWNYKIYKNYPTGQITYIGRVMPNSFQYNENVDVFKWQLTNIVDTIGGYVAHCAYTEYGGRHWVAWYTTDIPINDGPYKFRGLPGLIIKLYDNKEYYVFNMASIEHVDEEMFIEYEYDRAYVYTTREGFLKAQENLRFDIINRAKDAGINDEGQQKAARVMLKRNNPIEF